jgi:hypothetical protein
MGRPPVCPTIGRVKLARLVPFRTSVPKGAAMPKEGQGRVIEKNASLEETREQSAPHAIYTQGTPPPPDKRQSNTNENSAQQLTITWIMCAEPEDARRRERRMSERPPRLDAEGVRLASAGEGTLRLRWSKNPDTLSM